jgi:hypothetical protein
MTADLIPARLGHAMLVARDETIERRREIAREFSRSRYAKALRVDGEIVAVYSLIGSALSGEARICLLVDPGIDRHARALMTACEEEFSRLRAEGLRLTARVAEHNDVGLRFVRRWGFTVTGLANGEYLAVLEPGRHVARPGVRYRDGRPFIVLTATRSGTFFLSRLLSYGAYECGYEQMRYVHSLDDARSWFSQDFTGTAETAAAPWWRLIRGLRPDVRILVVRRPVVEIVDSWLRLDMRGVRAFDRAALTAQIARLDRYLARIERVPGALSVQFRDLATEDTARQVFEHCLPYAFDREWWASLATSDIQADQPSIMRYADHHRPQMQAAAMAVRQQMRRVLGARLTIPEPDADGVVIQREHRHTFWRDAQRLMAEHCVAVGEEPDQFMRKNLPLLNRLDEMGAGQVITARLNGRMVGYLLSVVAPSLEAMDLLTATQLPFFVSRDAAGLNLGLRLQRAAIADAERRKVGEMYGRAGIRGEGARLGILFRRLGFEEFGTVYKLTLNKAA